MISTEYRALCLVIKSATWIAHFPSSLLSPCEHFPMSPRPLCLLCFRSSDLISPAVTSATFISQSGTLALTCLRYCQLPSRVCGSFHLDYPSSHEHLALGKTHILLLQASAVCPLLLGTFCRCFGLGSLLSTPCPPPSHSCRVLANHCDLFFKYPLLGCLCPVTSWRRLTSAEVPVSRVCSLLF